MFLISDAIVIIFRLLFIFNIKNKYAALI